VVPLHWRKYKSPVSMSLGHWFEDFKKRLQQVDENSARLTAGKQLGDIWLGGLFMPEAFITATRQTAAQLNRWSLEELEMSLSLQSGGDNSFPVIGMFTLCSISSKQPKLHL
jgi:dynein heavy chain 1